MVAKSYQGLAQIGEPYEKNKKMYILIQTKNGGNKEVRWYTDKEYAKMYPGETVATAADFDAETAFGFTKAGFIWLVTNCGDHTDEHMLEINHQHRCFMYNEYFGWFVRLDWWENNPEKVPGPTEIIELVEPVYWAEISKDNKILPVAQVRAICDAKRGYVSTSEFQYSIDERHTIMLELTNKVELKDHFGTKFKYTFTHDATGNVFEWTTAAVNLEPHQDYEVTGTVKEYKTEKNTKITVLTRCKVK